VMKNIGGCVICRSLRKKRGGSDYVWKKKRIMSLKEQEKGNRATPLSSSVIRRNTGGGGEGEGKDKKIHSLSMKKGKKKVAASPGLGKLGEHSDTEKKHREKGKEKRSSGKKGTNTSQRGGKFKEKAGDGVRGGQGKREKSR